MVTFSNLDYGIWLVQQQRLDINAFIQQYLSKYARAPCVSSCEVFNESFEWSCNLLISCVTLLAIMF